MSAYFYLTLDTAPPVIRVVHPPFAVRYQTGVSIVIYGNEQMMQEEIYIIDSEGQRIDLIFDNEGDTLIGYYNFGECAFGTATIYVSVRDYLDNVSPLYSSTIEVLSEGEGQKLTGVMSNKSRKIISLIKERNIEIDSIPRKVSTSIKSRRIEVNHSASD
jgi:hypothetical protein